MTGWLAPALLFGGCAWFGFALAARLKAREKALAALERQLRRLANYVVRLNMPMPDALCMCGGDMQKVAQGLDEGLDLAQSFGGAYASAGLSQQDLDALCAWAGMMEGMHRQDCENVLSGVAQEMRERREKAAEAARRDGAMCRTLGICLGAALAVLIW